MELIVFDTVAYIPMFDTEHIQKSIIRPLSYYEKTKDNVTLLEIQNAIKIANMMVSGFRDILDELNFDDDKLRTLQFSLDDNYDEVEKVYKTTTDQKTKDMIDTLLTNIAKLDMEIGDLILEHTYAS